MLFLLRTAFWLMIIVLLLPTDERQRSEVYGTAQAAVHDLATFCDRNPETCAKGKDAFGVLVQKAQFGARMLIDLINGTKSAGEGEGGTGIQDPDDPNVSRAKLRNQLPLRAIASRLRRIAGHAQSRRSRRGLGRSWDLSFKVPPVAATRAQFFTA